MPNTTTTTADGGGVDSEATADADSGHPYVDFAAFLAVLVGLAALGFGTGLHVSLIAFQGAIIETTRIPLETQAGDLYPVLVQLQSWANISLYAAAGLLVGGATLGEREQLRDRVHGLVGRLENHGGEDDA